VHTRVVDTCKPNILPGRLKLLLYSIVIVFDYYGILLSGALSATLSFLLYGIAPLVFQVFKFLARVRFYKNYLMQSRTDSNQSALSETRKNLFLALKENADLLLENLSLSSPSYKQICVERCGTSLKC
jgi:hypothetical protein